MAYSFSTEQFNRETMPKRLGNWEVPRWAPSKARPLEYRPDPKPICDINGHFLPGAKRGTSKCFGHFLGTWDMPRKITREVAAKLAKEPPDHRFPDWLKLRVQRPKMLPPRMRAVEERKAKKAAEKAKAAEPLESYQDFSQGDELVRTQQKYQPQEHLEINEKEFPDPLGLNEQKDPIDADGHGPYIPGSLTDPDKRHESYDVLVKNAVEKLHGPQEDENTKFWRKVAENAKNDHSSDNEDMKQRISGTPKLPAVSVTQNYQFAKKMHDGNLEHQPLPDTLGYRNLTKIGQHRDSDIVVKPYAIGWRGYGASGPTCCTKIRVHRPKTCDVKKTDAETQNILRPCTSAPDLGAQYKRPLSLMDLAICWDFRPEDPKSEPKPPKHIDGSNGSKAPAVFTMIHTPKEEPEDITRLVHCNPIFNQNRQGDDPGYLPAPCFEKNMTKEKRKDSCDVQNCSQHSQESEKGKRINSGNKQMNPTNKKPACDGIHGCGTPSDTSRQSKEHNKRPEKLQSIKEAWKATDDMGSRNSVDSYEKTSLAQGKLHQSSPAESQSSRRSTKDSLPTNNNCTKHKTCVSCNGVKTKQDPKRKEDYKFAFKAGNPNSVQSSSSGTHSSDSKGVKMPKLRHPYTKKSYTIPTLAPPFSIWKDANTSGYPEHWRLASVYQHAYKPPEQRRKSLIASVFQ